MRDAGSNEHSALDEHGLPIEWRTTPRPEFNTYVARAVPDPLA
jgi:hypothetical protein